MECAEGEGLPAVKSQILCYTRHLGKIKDSIDSVIDSITLQDMLDDYEKLNMQDNMYYI